MKQEIAVQTPSGAVWDSLTVAQRDQVRRLLEACRYVAGAPRVTAALHDAAISVGCSYSKMRERYYEWLQCGQDWRCLMDGRARGMKERSRTTASAFVTYFKAICLQSQRSTEQAIDELYRRWRKGEEIPGYEDVWNRKTLPPGWSRANLRRLAPSRRERTLMRQGIKAAYKMLPQVFSSRADLAPMQYVMFDDVWMDHLVHYSGKVARPLMLGCNDLYTGMRLMQGMKPRIMRKDGTNTGLGKLEMLQIVVGLLYTIGYNPAGTTLICEHGTASINKEEEELISSITGGVVKVGRSGMAGKVQVLLNGYTGRQGGNPRGKAGLESWHNPYHNLMAMLVTVGHMGHNHGATAPEIITGQIDEEKKLLALMDGIQSETKEQAQHHIYSFKDYAVMAEQAKWLMNIRTHHALNDWKECGFETAEYRLGTSTPWTPMSAVKQELLPMVSQLVASSPDLFRTRRMSPSEAWETSIKSIPGGLRRISAVDVCDILGKHMAKRLRVGDGCTIIVQDADIADTALRYELAVTTQDGLEKELNPDGEYYGFVNPYDMGRMFILTPELRYLGTSRLIKRVPRADRAAYEAAQGRVNARRARILRPLRVTMEDREAEIETTRAHNVQVLDKARQTDLGMITPAVPDSPDKPSPKSRRDALAAILTSTAPSDEDDDEDGGVNITNLF